MLFRRNPAKRDSEITSLLADFLQSEPEAGANAGIGESPGSGGIPLQAAGGPSEVSADPETTNGLAGAQENVICGDPADGDVADDDFFAALATVAEAGSLPPTAGFRSDPEYPADDLMMAAQTAQAVAGSGGIRSGAFASPATDDGTGSGTDGTADDRTDTVMTGSAPDRTGSRRFPFSLNAMSRICGIVGAAMVAGICTASNSLTNPDAFRLRQVQFEGLQLLSASYLMKKLELETKASGLDTIVNSLESNQWIQNASATRIWQGILRIKIEEKIPAAIWHHRKQIYILSEDGNEITVVERQAVERQFSPAFTERLTGLPVVTGNGAPKALATLFGAMRDFPNFLGALTKAEYLDQQRWRLILAHRVVVELPTDRPVTIKEHLQTLEQFSTDNPNIFDYNVRFDFRYPDSFAVEVDDGAPDFSPKLKALRQLSVLQTLES